MKERILKELRENENALLEEPCSTETASLIIARSNLFIALAQIENATAIQNFCDAMRMKTFSS